MGSLREPLSRPGLWPHLPVPWGWVLRRAPALWTSHSSRWERAPSLSPASPAIACVPDPLRARVSMECQGPDTPPAGRLVFRGSNSQATGKGRLQGSLVQTTQRCGARAFLRDRQGSEFLAHVCTKNLSLLAPDMQLIHVS